MTSDDLLLLQFVRLQSVVRSMLRKSEIALQKLAHIRSVTVDVSPFGCDSTDWGLPIEEQASRLSLSFFMDVELANGSNPDSTGMAITIQYSGGSWKAEGDLGWSRSDGWESIWYCERNLGIATELYAGLPGFAAEVVTRFEQHLAQEIHKLEPAPRGAS